MAVQCTGPMPPSEFIGHFLVDPDTHRPPSAKLKIAKPSEGGQTFSFDCSPLCPSIAFSSSPPSNVTSDTSEESLPKSHLYGRMNLQGSASPSPFTIAPQIVELLIDYVQVDPFRDPGPEVQDRQDVNFQRTSPKARYFFSRHFSAIEDVFTAHPRVFLFSVLITDQGARLLRWDRAGVVVTERFDHNSSDSPLSEFLWRFNSMTPEQHGHDLTFSRPTPQDISIARDAFSRSTHDIPSEAPLYKVSVTDDVSEEEFFFVVSTPQACNDRVYGTASRGYIAVDLRDGSLVWLKDVWRDDDSSSFKEGDTYRKLAEQGVPHIAPLVCAADVPSQVTRTQAFAEAPWTCVPPIPVGRVHYRIVLGAVGRPLSSFRSTHELCTSIRDAIEAHAKAYTSLNILHGDISSGNILITDDGRGLLIDWELSFDASVGRRGSVIGTWQFVSSRLMANPEEVEHLLCDDLESFLHVLAYLLILHRPTGVRDLVEDIDDIYNRGYEENNTFIVCRHKHSFLAGCTLRPTELVGYLPKPLTDLVDRLRRLFNHGLYAGLGYVTKRQRKDAHRALQTPNRVLKIFDSLLKRRAWPADDGSMDAVGAYLEKIEPYESDGEELHWRGKDKRAFSDAFEGFSSELSPRKRRCFSCSSTSE